MKILLFALLLFITCDNNRKNEAPVLKFKDSISTAIVDTVEVKMKIKEDKQKYAELRMEKYKGFSDFDIWVHEWFANSSLFIVIPVFFVCFPIFYVFFLFLVFVIGIIITGIAAGLMYLLELLGI